MRRRLTARLATAAAALAVAPALVTAQTVPSPPPGYEGREDVSAFVRQLVSRHPQLDDEVVATALADARYQPQVARLIMPAASPAAKNWKVYRSRFLDTLRVREGVKFWRDNEAVLAAAEARWGVPAAVIVAIIGVETIYGRQTGGFRAIDALSTLAFDFPRGRSDRSAFFRDELEALFVLAARDRVNVMTIRGSYAGALGMPQFMPSSWLKFAVDFDEDGRVDAHQQVGKVTGKVGVAGDVHEEVAVLVPEESGESGLDGAAALDFFRFVIKSGRAFFNGSQTVDDAALEEQHFRQ